MIVLQLRHARGMTSARSLRLLQGIGRMPALLQPSDPPLTVSYGVSDCHTQQQLCCCPMAIISAGNREMLWTPEDGAQRTRWPACL